MKRNKFFKRK